MVAIDLEKDDDAQVIFETLNARGEPLLPADLLRNYIFLRAARGGEPQEQLYREFWQPFDDEFWRKEVKQGRLLRPRSDLFMQHLLASKQGREVPIKHLFVEYKYWITSQHPFASVREELAALAASRAGFRRIVEPRKGDVLWKLTMFLDAFDARTAYPALMTLLEGNLTDEGWSNVSSMIESFLLRRAVCGLTTKNYNRVFLGLTRALRREGLTAERVATYLLGQEGESTEWPTDAAFSHAWLTTHAYGTLNNPKIVYILKRLNDTYAGVKTEALTIEGPLTVEHLLPQQWITNWRLPDGSTGLQFPEFFAVDASDPRRIATTRRNAALQTFGNLTLLTQALNSSVSTRLGPSRSRKSSGTHSYRSTCSCKARRNGMRTPSSRVLESSWSGRLVCGLGRRPSDRQPDCRRHRPVVVWMTRTNRRWASRIWVVRPCSASRSRIAAHSIAEPRAIAKNRARSAAVTRPTPSAMQSTVDALARRN